MNRCFNGLYPLIQYIDSNLLSLLLGAGCPRPPSIDNGRIKEPFRNNFGDKLIYECDNGYYLTGRQHRLCLANGTWDGQEPSCETGESINIM